MCNSFMKRVIAAIAAAAITLGQCNVALAAEETAIVSSATVDGESTAEDKEAVESDEASSAESSSEEETVEEDEESSKEEDGIGEEVSEDAGVEASTEDDATEEASDASSEEASDAASEETSEEEKEAAELPEGINEMPEDYKIPEELQELKKEAASDNTLEKFNTLEPGEDYLENQVIAFADNEEEAKAIANTYSGELMEYSYGVATISLKDSGLTVGEAFGYALDSELELPYVEPNYVVEPIEPIESTQLFGGMAIGTDVASGNGFADRWWNDNIRDPYLNPANYPNYQWFHGAVNSYSAWGVTTGSSNVVVAVIDTGVNASHQDLGSGKLAGWVDFVGNTSSPSDSVGHGTHVSSIIAGKLDGALGSGIAPGVRILALKALSESSGNNAASNVIKAIKYAAGKADAKGTTQNGSRRADIINMSLGSSSRAVDAKLKCSLEEAAIDEAYKAGVTVVASMGNDNNSNTKNYPAAAKHVIAVCASNESGNLATFSTYGAWADISAPGSNIYAADAKNPGKYVSWDGTSMAAPIVSGACALYMSAVGHVDPDTMEKVLKSSVTGSAGAGTGVGILDIAKMFKGDTTAPRILLSTGSSVEGGKKVTVSGKVAADAKITMTPLNFGGSASANSKTKIVYTTDGSNPSVDYGDVVNGVKYTGPISVGSLVGESDKVTVKAAAVTGMGVIGKVSTLVLTVDATAGLKVSKNVVKITNAPKKLTAGKSIKLEAQVTTAATASKDAKKLTWKIDDNKLDAKINASTGALTTKAGKTGTITVTCVNKDSSASNKVTIQIVNDNPVNKISIKKQNEKANLTIGSAKLGNTIAVTISELKDTKGKDVIKDKSLQWTSSNLKVFGITESGSTEPALSSRTDGVTSISLRATGAGTATLTCKALDGSGKKATLKVTVTRLADSITLSGQSNIATGNKATYKASVLPAKASNKKVTWSLETPYAGVTVDAKGTVTVAKDAKAGQFKLKATAADNSGVKGSMTVTVTKDKTSRMDLGLKSYAGTGVNAPKYDKNNSLTSIRLYNVDIPDAANRNENSFTVSRVGIGSSNVNVSWSNSNSKVVELKDNGNGTATISGKANGTANITCTAQDGSNKKATVKVTVITPASSMDINPAKGTASERMGTIDATILALGCSTTSKAAIGTAYGKPSVSKVNWDYEVGVFIRASNGALSFKTAQQLHGAAVSEYIKKNKLFFNFSNGKVTAKGINAVSADYAKLEKATGVVFDNMDHLPAVRIKATTTDGTEYSSYEYFSTTAPIKSLKVVLNGSTRYTGVIISKNWINTGSEGVLDLQVISGISGMAPFDSFSVTSSNPNVATAKYAATTVNGKTKNRIVVSPVGKGTTTLTITALDGSNKKCTYKVIVQ